MAKPVASEKKKEEMGLMANQNARKNIEEKCHKAGLTIERVAETVAAALKADVIRVVMDITGTFKYSKAMPDHQTRLKAVEQGVVLLDLKPSDRVKVDVLSTLPDEVIDRRLEQLLKKA